MYPLIESFWDGFFYRLTYGAGELPRALLQQTHDLSLLGGGASAANHSGTLTRKLHELVLVVFQTNLQEKQPDRRD